MTLSKASEDILYRITDIDTGDEETDEFLLTLGCYVGGKVTVVSKIKGGLVVAIKDARYSIDNELADTIEITEA